MATLPTLPRLPSFRSPAALLEVGGGGGGGVATPPTFGGGPEYGWSPPILGNPAGGQRPPSGNVAQSGGAATGAASSIWGCLTSPGQCLLRIVLLILGLICVAGAIYLYKPGVVQPVIKGAKRAALAAVEE